MRKGPPAQRGGLGQGARLVESRAQVKVGEARFGLRLGADLRVVSGSFDDPGNLVRHGGYEVHTLRGEWSASDHVTLFGRVENVWDESYQTAAGYATPGRGAYVGARARL